MKNWCCVCIVLNFLIAQNISGQSRKEDTLFLKKDTDYGSLQSVFIEKNKNSVFYNYILDFEFDEFDKQHFQWSLDYLMKNKISLTKQKNILPSNKWIQIKFLNNDFYAYHPCDFFTFFQASITDSTYLEITGEGPVANKILSQRKISNATFEIKTTGMYQQNRTIKIYLINQDKGIAVFEEHLNDGSQFRYLMAESNKIKKLPFIVNRCDNYKQEEFEFEEPDFERLIKNLK
ncbi:hypothetical protein MG290_14300 [Flavobacterium sp. CBA20B-1]|uniref:hypothetical protein n=1 Tax=unclassified Flavobacterium TaxID=196869 RepID=UPI0022247E11|nr:MULTISPECIES: hypothetical protein [unclassified Flavobacterium]WCM42082.1 hypothetical protein MG290_14300 [Flavobacterium sp. CBA20B-1]